MRVSSVLWAGLLLFTINALGETPAPQHSLSLDIPSQPIGDALSEFGKQSGLQVVLYSAAAQGIVAPRVAGKLTAEEALDRLLADSGLEYEFLSSNGVAVREKTRASSGARAPDASATPHSRSITLAQAEAASAANPAASAAIDEASAPIELEEVVVTGTHIRGRGPVGSPLTVYDRRQIEESGAGSIEQFLRKIPQNQASADADTFVSRQQDINTGRGSGVDLRGLGSGATLVLVNGHRPAPAGDGGTFFDVSLIPLTAVERVEVLTDGASAIYGADAVAGVVNFVLRRSFSGAETSLRYADTTEGGAREYSAAQLLGGTWASGHGMLSLEHSHQDPLFTDERDFIAPQPGRFAVLPQQKRNTVFASATQGLGRVEAFGDLFASRREFVQDFLDFFNQPLHGDGEATAYDGVLGLRWAAAADWQATVSSNYSRHEDETTTTSPLDEELNLENNYRSSVYGLEGRVEGPLFEHSAGVARLVAGAGFRHEEFDDFRGALGNGVGLKRDVSSVFGEIMIPLLAARDTGAITERLVVSLAGRYDDYSDAGSAVTPKVGLNWSPLPGMALRGTFGRSFRAAPLSQVSDANPFYFVFQLPDPAADDLLTNTLFLNSPGNPGLGPERSRSFTAGIDIRPAALPAFALSTTYFNIRYRDRIQGPPISSPFAIFFEADTLAPFIVSPSDPAEVAAIYQEFTVADFGSVGGENGENIEALFDIRLQNIAETRTRGVDLTTDFTFDSALGSWRLFVNGTYLIESNARALSTTPSVNVLNTTFDPMDLRLRGGVSLRVGRLSAALLANYADNYRNDLLTPADRVASWTTADLNLTYQPQIAALEGLRLSFNVQNVLNKDPPPLAVSDSASALGYDIVNGNARGRSLSLAVTKSW